MNSFTVIASNLEMTNKEDGLSSQMVNEAFLILNSVGFIEKELERQFALLEEAANNNFYEDIGPIKQRIHALLSKIGEENKNMDDFMVKYKKKVDDEKTTILSGVK